LSDLRGDWGPLTTVRFPNQEARDGFLRSVAISHDGSWEAKAMPEDALGAWVRWRAGHFLMLNDLAYVHGGRIAVTVDRHRG
jgi:hypothetical protein